MNKRFVLASSMIAALALTACGGGNGDETTETGGGDGQAQIAPELNIAYNAQPPSLDPLMTTAHATRIMARVIFEPLLALDAEGEVQPVLAEDYEVSEDGLTLTFALREGITFHDGSELTAEDVIASFERWQELSTVGPTYFDDAEFDAPEEGVFEITLPEPMYVAPELIADPAQMPHIMPASVIEEADVDGIQDYIGTGPYEFGEWATDQYIRFDAFEDYVSPDGDPSGMAGAKTAYFEEMYFQFVSDSSTRVTGIQTGEYDLIHPVPQDNIEAIENDDNVENVFGESGLAFGVFNKDESNVMSDVNMRRAVLAAMETEPILFAAFGDEDLYGNNSAIMPPDSPWFVEADPDFEDLHQNQDLDLAQEYLDEAGYDGETVRILTTRDYEDMYDHSVVLQQQLEEAGMNTDLIVNDWPTVTELREDPEQYEITITGISNWPVVPATFHFFNPNWVGWTDSEDIFSAAEAMTSAADQDEAVAAMDDLQAAFEDYIPVAKFGDRTSAGGQRVEFTGYDYVTGVGEIFHHIRPVE